MTQFPKTEQSRIKRLPKRGHYEIATIHQIIDEALICHVGFVENDQPYVIPSNFARIGDTLILHGAKASRLLKHAEAGHPLCIEATVVDGLVLARAVAHHSINYRSVVLFGRGRPVTEPDEKMAALKAVTDHLIPGRWDEARPPSRKELNATRVVAVKIDQASAKIRSGPPGDDEADYALPVWAGILPLQQKASPPIRDERLTAEIATPGSVAKYSRKQK